MAKVTLKLENSSFLTLKAPNFIYTFASSSTFSHRRSFSSSTSRRPIYRFRTVTCSVKEKEEVEVVPTVLRGEGEEGLGGDRWEQPWRSVPPRYKLIGTTSRAFAICNMDKVNLSVAIIPMSHQIGWNSSVAGLMQSSFFWGYASSQLPGGWLGKIFGWRLE